jgi:DNA-binding NarL/FixJ family response regulator
MHQVEQIDASQEAGDRAEAARPIRVLIADDQALLRGGLRAMLEADPAFEVVGEAEDGAAAVELALRTHPDVVLMDVRMPRLDGIEATRRLLAAGSRARVLVITTFDLDEYAYEALRAGASGFLLKATAPGVLVDAVRTVAAGESMLDPQVTRRLVEHYLARPEPDADTARRLAELTEREREVLLLLARGLSNEEMGERLFLSPATVKSHVTRILGKLDVRSRVQAVILAYETGLVRPGAGER